MYLAMSIAFLGLGPVLYHLAGQRCRWLIVLDGCVVLAVGALVLLHILPHSFEMAGVGVMAPLMIGLLGPTLIERWLVRAEAHAHLFVLLLSMVGLGLHALTDGIILGRVDVFTGGHGGVYVLPIAIVLHRIPAGLVIWRLLYSDYGLRWALGTLGVIGASTVVGFMASSALHFEIHTPWVGLFQGLIAGSLLHVVVHSLQPHRHT